MIGDAGLRNYRLRTVRALSKKDGRVNSMLHPFMIAPAPLRAAAQSRLPSYPFANGGDRPLRKPVQPQSASNRTATIYSSVTLDIEATLREAIADELALGAHEPFLRTFQPQRRS